MSDLDMVTIKSDYLATLLKDQFHGTGDELGQLISSCEERLPHDVLGKLHYIATIHDEAIHQSEFVLMDVQAFMEAYEQCVEELAPRSTRFIWRAAAWLMVVITLLALILYYLHWEKVEASLLN